MRSKRRYKEAPPSCGRRNRAFTLFVIISNLWLKAMPLSVQVLVTSSFFFASALHQDSPSSVLPWIMLFLLSSMLRFLRNPSQLPLKPFSSPFLRWLGSLQTTSKRGREVCLLPWTCSSDSQKPIPRFKSYWLTDWAKNWSNGESALTNLRTVSNLYSLLFLSTDLISHSLLPSEDGVLISPLMDASLLYAQVDGLVSVVTSLPALNFPNYSETYVPSSWCTFDWVSVILMVSWNQLIPPSWRMYASPSATFIREPTLSFHNGKRCSVSGLLNPLPPHTPSRISGTPPPPDLQAYRTISTIGRLSWRNYTTSNSQWPPNAPNFQAALFSSNTTNSKRIFAANANTGSSNCSVLFPPVSPHQLVRYWRGWTNILRSFQILSRKNSHYRRLMPSSSFTR